MQRAPLPLVTRALAWALALGGLAWPAGAASQGWTLARSPHFVVAGDAGEKKLRLVAHQFEQLRGLLQSVSKLKVDSPRPIVVLALRDGDSLERLLPPAYLARGRARPVGLFARGADLHHAALRVDVGGGEVGPYHVLYHEYLHLLNEINFPSLPLWLNEGLAEYYATADVDEREARFGQILPQHVLLLRESGNGLPLEQLFAVDHTSPEYTRTGHAGVFYAQSAALTHYFLMGDKGAHRRELNDYLQLQWQGVPEGEAQQRAFGGLPDLQRRYTSYVRGLRFYGMKVPVVLDPASIVTALLGDSEALALQADFALHTGQLDRARDLAGKALVAQELGLAHRVLGGVHARQGRPAEALAELERAAALAPMDPVAHYQLGVTRRPGDESADRARREQALRRALELSPAYVPAVGALATLLADLGRHGEALTLAQRAAQIEPQQAAWRLRLASALRAVDRAADADRVEAELLRAASADLGVLVQATWYFRQAGRLDEAVALLAKAQASRPRDARLLLVVGENLAQLERHDEAEAAFRAALAVRPDDPGVLNALGYLNVERGVRLPEALALIEKALKLQPDNPSVLDSRGWALFKLGRLAEAERDLRRALESLPSAVVLDHLGDVLAAQGRPAEAEAAWRQALEQRDATDERRTAIQRKLEPSPPAPAPAA